MDSRISAELANAFRLLKDVFMGEGSAAIQSGEDAILDSDKKVRIFGYSVIGLVFFGLGTWAGCAPLESAALGQGTVQVEGDSKTIQHLEGGLVSDILVTSGDYVLAGQPLIQLDPTQVAAEQTIIEGRLWAKRALVDRLLSERENRAEIAFQDWLLAQQDERALISMGNETALFNARRADRMGEVAVLRQRISQLESEIDGAHAIITSKERIAASMQTESVELAELLVDGYVDKQRIRQLERSIAETLGELAELQARVASAEVAIKEAELNILQLNKRFKTQVTESLASAQDEFFDMQQRLLAVNDRLNRTVIKAPAAGYVFAVKPNVEGAVISAGAALMSIVPDVDKLVVDAKMSPMDIDRIRVGQEAEVRFAVFKDAYTITGSLVRVSADSLVDEQTGEPYFEAKVELLADDLALLGDYQLVPGMPAEVLVKTGTRTLLGYITSPLQRMFEKSLIED